MIKNKVYKYFDPAEYKQDKTLWLQLVVNIVCLALICFAVYVSLHSVLMVKSLWNDEASLAYSLINRPLSELTSKIFENEQSAPVLYLYIVKVLTLLFGHSETTLRIFSFISYLATLAATYYLASRVLKMKLPMLPTTLVAVLYIIMMYANEFKPYMTDCAVVLSTLVVYYLYCEQKVKAYWVILIYALSVWLSNPSCFFVGSILLYEFIDGICKKDFGRIRFWVICGVVVLLSFAIYFFYWLKPVSESPYMIDFWESYKFPLIPTSMQDLYTMKYHMSGFILNMGKYHLLIFYTAFAGLFINLFLLRNQYLYVIYGGVAAALFASMIGKYPFVDRMFLFLFPILILLFFYFLCKLYSKNLILSIGVVILSFVVIESVSDLRQNLQDKNIYKPKLETNFAIDYMRQNIKEGDHAYIYYYCRTPFLYKNNYDSLSFAEYKNNVLIGKSPHFAEGQNKDEIDRIVEHAPLYILAAYPWEGEQIDALLNSLRAKGNLLLVHDKYETNVYYYTVNSY